ncbi:MAG: PLP-dependent transferase, partial [Ignavibacteriales bacterium]|nr:PLP-dependent transferase [Ignavibacteriales bacterium]
MKFSTKAIHTGQTPDPNNGAVMTPVYLTSTYVQDGIGKPRQNYEYSRVTNPTRTALEECLASLENGKHGMAFGSGMAAIDSLFHLLKPNDHIIFSRNLYGGTYRIANFIWKDFGITFDFVDTTNINEVEKVLRKETKMIFVETPTNPTMEITDLKLIAKFAKKNKILSVVDNTFATPYLQQPIDLGIDIVTHSLTKYLNGHSDMLGGIVITNNEQVAERLKYFQKCIGGILSPFDAWLCLRGVKTLSVRMEQHGKSAMQVAKFLSSHKKIKHVYFPGLKEHPQHQLAKRQMKNFGGMISFDVGSLANAKKFLAKVKLCALAE